MKPVIYRGKGRISVDEAKVPEFKNREVIIKMGYAGICGMDLSIEPLAKF